MRISDWSSDVCSSDLAEALDDAGGHADEALGLVLVEAGGADDLLELRRLCAREVLRSRVAGEELRRDHVRSEERRVGKERVSHCNSGWSPYPSKKKQRIEYSTRTLYAST